MNSSFCIEAPPRSRVATEGTERGPRSQPRRDCPRSGTVPKTAFDEEGLSPNGDCPNNRLGQTPAGSAPWRPEHRELVRDLEPRRAEAEDRRRTAATPAGAAPLAGCLDDAAAKQDALEVRGRHVVSERGPIKLAELRDRELRRREREADVRVGELRAQALAAGQRDLAVVERHRWQLRHRMPGGVRWQLRVDAGRDEAEVCGRDLPLARVAVGVAESLELLEVRHLADVDLRRQVPANRLLECL